MEHPGSKAFGTAMSSLDWDWPIDQHRGRWGLGSDQVNHHPGEMNA